MLHEIEEADLRDRIEQVVEEYPALRLPASHPSSEARGL